MISNIISAFKKNLFLLISIFFIIGLSFSEAFISIFSGLLFLQLFLSENINKLYAEIKVEKSLWALIFIYLIFIFGFIFCKDIDTGMYELKKNIFWFIIPTGVALSSKLKSKNYWIILFAFVVFVTLASFATTFKVIFGHYFATTTIRDASYIPHVSFSLFVVFSIFIILTNFVEKTPVFNKINKFVLITWCLWLLLFIGVQKSLTGVIALLGCAFVFVIWLIQKMNNKKSKQILKLLLLCLVVFPLIYLSVVIYNFYNIKDTTPVVTEHTALNNTYYFNFDSNLKENGRYVHWYICEKELKKSWKERCESSIYDKDINGYPYYMTLIRYMTSKGLKKDAEGFCKLTDNDIENIKNGISNYIFAKGRFSIYPRIYQTIWEIDQYFRTGDPNNKSVSQRLEYDKVALHIIKNQWWGVGTGNFKIAFDKAYNETKTKLNPELRFNVHNQFLSYAVKFGVLGLILILFAIYFAINNKNGWNNILLKMLLTIIALSALGGEILESHTALPFFVFFLSLFLWHTPSTN